MVRTSEKMRNVAISWRNGEYYSHNANFLTTGEDVFSYGHRIGYTNTNNEKVLVDCHFSVTTAAQCNVLRDFVHNVELCRAHPKPGVVVEYTRPSDQLAGKPAHDPELLRAGIEAALGTIIVMKNGKVKYHERHIARLEAGLYRVLEGQNYYDIEPSPTSA